jgi:arginine/lysine/ornithine decarboxylase
MIKTPICDFVSEYVGKNASRFHMPGAKGKTDESFISRLNAYDITEIEGADYLYEPRGIIKESEEIAAKVYGVPHTFYSTEGSSLCIKTMLSLSCKAGEKVIATTNAHRAFSDGCKLLGLTPVWIEDIKSLSKALRGYPDAAAVFLTTPDYLGEMIDIKRIGELVRENHGRTLLIDSAHGAYLFFTNEQYAEGADIICTSAHKTLPVLTGGACMHVMNERFAANAAEKMKPFASTSPSYLTLQSLDMCNRMVSSDLYKEKLAAVIRKTAAIKTRYNIDTKEPLKICFKTEGNAAAVFEKYKIVPEVISENLIVLMISPANSDSDFEALENALSELKIMPADKKQKPTFIYSE